VVGDGISVNSNTSSSASLDHISELLSGSVSSIEFVGSWLIHEVPWVKLTILWPLVGENRFLWWENFDSHVPSFAKELALLSDVSIWPSKHLNDGSLLSILIVISLVDLSTLPHKVLNLLSNGVFFAISIGCFDNKGKSIRETGVNSIGSIRLETFVVEVVFHLGDAVVLSALGGDVGGASVGAVDDVVEAHDSTEAFIFRLVEVSIWTVLKEGLEASLGPVVWVSGLLATGAAGVAVEV